MPATPQQTVLALRKQREPKPKTQVADYDALNRECAAIYRRLGLGGVFALYAAAVERRLGGLNAE